MDWTPIIQDLLFNKSLMRSMNNWSDGPGTRARPGQAADTAGYTHTIYVF